jgi:hypothetical protein
MHDIDRTSTGYETGINAFETDQFEYGYTAGVSGESPFNEQEEIDLASELMGVTSDAELDQFLGDLLKKASRVIHKVAPRVMRFARPLMGALKPVAKQALPWVGGALGGALGGSAGTFALPGVGTVGGGALGTAAGTALGSALANALEMELGGLSPDEREFETARRFVRIAGSAVQQAAQAQPNADPSAVAGNAVTAATRQHVPRLATAASGDVPTGHSGRWVRRGNKVILFGV